MREKGSFHLPITNTCISALCDLFQEQFLLPDQSASNSVRYFVKVFIDTVDFYKGLLKEQVFAEPLIGSPKMALVHAIELVTNW